ncbi:MAG: hypothetical protein OXC92_07315 [Flavobacteriaceae bacterium]|nr:hypothetical protein [Flavobacteriaceae bacterium]
MKHAKMKIDFLKQYYTIDEIIAVFRTTKENANPSAYSYLLKVYNIKNFESNNW